MGTTKLTVWNNALIELGHKPLADTGETVVAGRTLTKVWDQLLEECLAEASWNFAMETIKAEADTGVEPNFGYKEVFAKPTDWLRTIAISGDENFSAPLLNYYDDSSFWSADYSPIYVRYVSDDTGLGLEFTRWPANFTRYVELELAVRSCYKLTQSLELKKEIEVTRNKARLRAKNIDAMNEPNPKFPPPSSWTTARHGNRGGDRGSKSNLTG